MNDDSKEFKIVVIGGGSGSSVVLRGLKSHTSELTAVVTMFDSGGSSGLLQDEFGYPPLGDLRQCLLGLSEDVESTRALREMIDFRFRQESSLNGHSLGNLLLAALTTLGKDLELAIDEMARLLRITGRVTPVALERADLCAELEDGRIVRGESNIDLRRERSPKIERVFLDPSTHANPKAIEAILDADVVVLGPGDLYTSIIPNLLTQGIPQALAATEGTRIYVCNLMTKLGETDGFKASDFVREITRYMNGPNLDWALINTRSISEAVQETYRGESAH
ncbi:MAG: YvcK family protein, partial [Chloroflexi bacterium]|nr:YvcK family protein [Chloroflexota bacterium]